MNYLLFTKASTAKENNIDKNQFSVEFIHPSLINGFHIPGEKLSKKELIFRLSMAITTLGRLRIYYVKDEKNQKIVHTSSLISKCFKFPFLKNSEYEIGPCYTVETYRGQGVYPMVLSYITAHVESSQFYMIVNESNSSSLRGIEKAGFQQCGTVYKTSLLKRYLKKE